MNDIFIIKQKHTSFYIVVPKKGWVLTCSASPIMYNAFVFCFQEKNDDRNLEMETWNGLANIYSKMAMWNDAEICLSKWKAINSFSPSLWHAIGKLCKAKGLLKEAKQAYEIALDIDPNHVDSLLSTAVVLKQLGDQPLSFIKRFLTDALNIDRTNHEAWFHLGLLLKDEGGGQSLVEAIDSLHVAAVLHETSPIEPFKR